MKVLFKVRLTCMGKWSTTVQSLEGNRCLSCRLHIHGVSVPEQEAVTGASRVAKPDLTEPARVLMGVALDAASTKPPLVLRRAGAIIHFHWEVSQTQRANVGSSTSRSTLTAVIRDGLLCQLQSEVLDGLFGGMFREMQL